MNLSANQIKQLKKLAHHLKPVVLLGQQGLSDSVINEIALSLDAHELIKVKLAGSEKDDRRRIGEEISQRLHASLIQIIGQMAIFYRPNEDKKKNRIIV
jgi:RNA-binding protein